MFKTIIGAVILIGWLWILFPGLYYLGMWVDGFVFGASGGMMGYLLEWYLGFVTVAGFFAAIFLITFFWGVAKAIGNYLFS